MRTIKYVIKSQPTMEGAGVKLKRAIGNHTPKLFDPFLLLDDFHSDNPDDYIRGFPSHPHRGIETITYMLHGEIVHKDSMGNGGIIQSGDIQWMTAGSGIIHSEMPKFTKKSKLLWGFQLWANLPKTAKMMEPRYRDIKCEDIVEVQNENSIVKIICGTYMDQQGPVQDIITQPSYFDVIIKPNSSFDYKIGQNFTIFAYVIEGKALFSDEKEDMIDKEHLVLWNKDDTCINIRTKQESVRFLLISGKPIGEPIAWYGPIVMNTQEELQLAFDEFNHGTFIKHPKPHL